MRLNLQKFGAPSAFSTLDHRSRVSVTKRLGRRSHLVLVTGEAIQDSLHDSIGEGRELSEVFPRVHFELYCGNIAQR